jgi:hypothetical protein
MLPTVAVFLRTVGLICCGCRTVALKNLALRLQLAALKRTVKRAHFPGHDRTLLDPARQHLAGLVIDVN